MSEVEPTYLRGPALDEKPEGAVVRDATGDTWEKVGGRWVCYDAKMDGETLVAVWGPITLVATP